MLDWIMIRALGLVLLALLWACADEAGRGGSQGAISRPVSATFAAGLPDVIEVRVADPEPVEQAELRAPDGRVYPAFQIDRDRVVQEGGGYSPFGVGVGVFGGSSSGVGTSFGVGLPLGGVGGAPREPQVASLARIRVDDMAAYRVDWPAWKVRLRLGEVNPRFMELPAPRPPQS